MAATPTSAAAGARPGLLGTIAADLRVTVDAQVRTGPKFWLFLIGRSVFAPQVHAVVLFRLAHALRRTPLGFVLRAMGVVWAGAELHPRAEVGPGLMLPHSTGVVIAQDVRVGRNLRLHQGATIGGARLTGRPDQSRPAVIGDDVIVGANAMVLMGTHIGDGAIIGANSVVTRDVPARSIVSGIPAVVVKMRDE